MDKCIDCHAADLCGEDVHVDHVLVDHAGAGPPRGHQVARHVAVRGVALRRRQGLTRNIAGYFVFPSHRRL